MAFLLDAGSDGQWTNSILLRLQVSVQLGLARHSEWRRHRSTRLQISLDRTEVVGPDASLADVTKAMLRPEVHPDLGLPISR